MDYEYKYNKYKHKYQSLQTQLGGKKKTNWTLFTEKEREQILKNYNTITNSSKSCLSNPDNVVVGASRGMYIGKNDRHSKQERCNSIHSAKKDKSVPIVHKDSLTAWCNQASELYGLTVGDITKMKFGDKIQVILMDRNVGDYAHGKKKNSTYDPTKEGLSYATYIHAEGLSGILQDDSGYIFDKFQWEVNLKSLNKKYPFWGPISECGDKKIQKIENLDPKIRIGWRGPAILMNVAKKFLPNKVKHYDDWWNDYAPFRYEDQMRLK